MDIQEIVAGIGSSQALQDAAGKVGINPEQAQGMLHGILEHANDPGAANMVESVAAKVGISPELVQQFLPHVMPLLQGHSENASEGVQGVLGGLMGSLGGLMGSGSEGGGGLMGLAKGLFGQKT